MSNTTEETTTTTTDEEETGTNPWFHLLASLGVLIFVLVYLVSSYHCFKVRKETHWSTHLIYWSIAIATVLFLPDEISTYLFSSLTVGLICMAFPTYESIRAVCTPDEEDDKEWLQYWTFAGFSLLVISSTAWIVNLAGEDQMFRVLGGFLCYWLYFPLTNGSSIVYENITVKYITPILDGAAIQGKMENFLKVLQQTAVNTIYVYIVWIVFLFLPHELKRFVAICVGTIYPIICSVNAAATEEVDDDTVWLTYWSCYGVLFLVMDFFETWLNWVPGFYSAFILMTVYLMLPMINGSEKVFRNLLVPMFGLKEMLMVRDAIKLRRQMVKDLHPERASKVQKAVSQYYNDDDHVNGATKLNDELLSMSSTFNPTIRLPKLSHFFGGGGNNATNDDGDNNNAPPTENTNLV